MLVAIVALSLIFSFACIIIVRALMFKPRKENYTEAEVVSVDTDKAVSDLAQMIRCKTVSNTNKELENDFEFDKFKQLLPSLFPAVYSTCEYEEPGARSILLRWRGKNSGSPVVLMAHYDVVSAVEEKWTRPAFDGIVENGVLWGRGTLDTKGTLNGILQAAEKLISENFTPENDIYFAFGGDEEINGHGASDIVALFKQRGISPAIVFDEGGAIVENVFPGVRSHAALIGISEKGMLNIEYSVSGGGGHSSAPPPHTPVGRLSRACVRIENNPFKFRISSASRQMFDTLGRHSTFLYRLIFANLWCFSPVLDMIARKSGGEFNAAVRTTVAFTQMEGSKGINVIPPYARMVSNVRIIAGDTVEGTVSGIKKIINDDNVKLSVLYGAEPSVISDTHCKSFERLKKAIKETWENVIVSPYPMVACSDSRHWGALSNKVYRFSAMALSKEERDSIHGNDERVPIEKITKIVEFYVRFIKSC